jgi:hypothetical protein
MYLKDNYSEDLNPSSTEIMASCMQTIMDILIEPAIKQDTLSQEHGILLAIIGDSFNAIASKADAYEKVFERGELNQDYRN